MFLQCVGRSIICNVLCSLVPDVIDNKYKAFVNKRLTNNVIKTATIRSALHCTTWCSMTDGCLAVNIIGNHDIICELTTGLSNEGDMEDDSSSRVFVSGKNNIQSCIFRPVR